MSYALGETVNIDFATVDSSGLPVAADTSPDLTVYEDSSGTPMAYLPTVVERGEAGEYSCQAALTEGNGFESGKSYNVWASATIAAYVYRQCIASFVLRANTIDDVAAKTGLISVDGLIVPAGTTQSVIVNGSKSGGTVGNVNSGSTKTIYVYVQSANGAAVTPTAIRYKRHDAKTKTQLKDWTTLTPGDPTVMTLAAADNALHNADRNSEQHILTIEATYSDGSKATGEWFLNVERIEFAT